MMPVKGCSTEMNGHGHEFVSESVSEADSDTRFFGSSDQASAERRDLVPERPCPVLEFYSALMILRARCMSLS